MVNSKGLRRGTRYMFSRMFRHHGITPLTKYLTVYKMGDLVDIKVRVHLLGFESVWVAPSAIFVSR